MKKPLKHDTWVKPYMTKYKGLLTLILVLGLATFICGGALMFTSGYLISKSATRPENILLIYVPVVLTRAFGIARPVFRYVERLTSHNWVLKVTSDLRKRLYQTLAKDASFFQQHFKTGDILGILADDLGHLQNLYLRTIFPTLVSWLLYVVIVIAIGYFSWFFALGIALLLFVIVVLMPLVSVAVQGARTQRQKQLQHDLYTDMTDDVLGLSDWVISGRQTDFEKRPQPTLKAARQNTLAIRRFEWWRDFLIQFIFGLVVLVIIVWTNQQFTANQSMANWIGAFVLCLFPLVDAFAPVSQGVQEWPLYRTSVERLNALKPVQRDLPQQQTLAAPVANIDFEAVDFRYTAEQALLLKQFSLHIHAGEKIAILGPSGAGKTTLLNLLLGELTPQAGQVSINQVPITALQKQRAQLIGMLDQKPFLFNTSVMNNIRLGKLNASDSAIMTALEAVELGPLMQRLPEGANTVVEEAGARFSGGEQQRLALARVLLQDAPITLLDEPTVGLDPITEKALLKTIFNVLQTKTVIWITHHLQGIEHADQIIFLEHGQIAMQGSPRELYRTNARFRKLYQMDQGLV